MLKLVKVSMSKLLFHWKNLRKKQRKVKTKRIFKMKFDRVKVNQSDLINKKIFHTFFESRTSVWQINKTPERLFPMISLLKKK